MIFSYLIFVVPFLVIYVILDILGFFPWSTLYGAWPWQRHKGDK